MGVIIKELLIRGDKGQKVVPVVFDSGASASFIRRELAQTIATLLSMPQPRKFGLGDGDSTLTVSERTVLDVELEPGVEVWGDFHVVDKLSDEVIVGAPFLQAWRIKLDLEHEDIEYDKARITRRVI